MGSIVTDDGRCALPPPHEIRRRLQRARCAFQRRKDLLITSSNIVLKIRKNLLKTYVWSAALYGSETRTIKKYEENKILAFESWCYRRIVKIRRVDRNTNEGVFRRVGEE